MALENPHLTNVPSGGDRGGRRRAGRHERRRHLCYHRSAAHYRGGRGRFRLVVGRNRHRRRTRRGLDSRLDLARLFAHVYRRHRRRLRPQGRADHLHLVRFRRGIAPRHRFPLLRPEVRRDRLAGADHHVVHFPGRVPTLQPPHRQGHPTVCNRGYSGNGRSSAALHGGLAAITTRGEFLLALRPYPVGHRAQRRNRQLGRVEPHARFRVCREGSGGGCTEVHAVVRRVRAGALPNLDLRFGPAAAHAPSGQRVGERGYYSDVLLKEKQG